MEQLPPQAFLEAVLANLNIGVGVTDRQFRYRWVNQSFLDLTRNAPSDVVGRSGFELLHPDDLEEADRAFSDLASPRAADADIGMPSMLRILRGDGTDVLLEVAVIALFDVPEIDGFVVRLRRPRGQDHIDAALHGMAAGVPVEEVLAHLLDAASDVVEGGTPSFLPLDDAVGRGASEAGKVVYDVPIPALVGDFVLRFELPVGYTLLHSTTVAIGRLADVIGLAIDRNDTVQELQYHAHHDALTGCENRRSFEQRLRALADAGSAGGWGVLLLDLDGFKPVNDRLGHAAGDAVLRIVTRRVRAALRPTDHLARLGGDEFAVLCPAIGRLGDLEPIGARVVGSLTGPMQIDSETVEVGTSVGACWVPIGASPATEVVLAAADDALYEAKRAGGRTFRLRSL